MRAAKWCTNPSLAKKNDPSAEFQELKSGAGPVKCDEYSVEITSMPSGLSAEAYLLEFAEDPNKAIGSSGFNFINVFKKRTPGRVCVGDIYDIDILGPDNGSIVLVDTSKSFGKSTGDMWFDIQTIKCDKYGTHPECGAREFGFNYARDSVVFYTRGISRARTTAHRTGNPIQHRGWMAMMKGIAGSIKKRGGTVKDGAIKLVSQ